MSLLLGGSFPWSPILQQSALKTAAPNANWVVATSETALSIAIFDIEINLHIERDMAPLSPRRVPLPVYCISKVENIGCCEKELPSPSSSPLRSCCSKSYLSQSSCKAKSRKLIELSKIRFPGFMFGAFSERSWDAFPTIT